MSSAWRSAVELSPAHTSNTLGSTAHRFVCGLQHWSSSRPNGNRSVRVSPGRRATRRTPSSCRTGRDAEPDRWCTYSCATASPATAPVSVTSTDVAAHPPLIFDHAEMIARALAALRAQLDSLPLGASLLPGAFTMPELQRLYETVLGGALDRRNFQKRMLELGLAECLPGQRPRSLAAMPRRPRATAQPAPARRRPTRDHRAAARVGAPLPTVRSKNAAVAESAANAFA